MCTTEFTPGGGPTSPPISKSSDCKNDTSFQKSLVLEHSITECYFWCMVCKYFGLKQSAENCLPLDPDSVPASMKLNTDEIATLIHYPGVDCNLNSVRMVNAQPGNTSDNNNILVSITTHQDVGLFDQSIALFLGLVNPIDQPQFQNCIFNFYQAIVNVTNADGSPKYYPNSSDQYTAPGVVFNISDVNNNILYYCDISGMNP